MSEADAPNPSSRGYLVAIASRLRPACSICIGDVVCAAPLAVLERAHCCRDCQHDILSSPWAFLSCFACYFPVSRHSS